MLQLEQCTCQQWALIDSHTKLMPQQSTADKDIMTLSSQFLLSSSLSNSSDVLSLSFAASSCCSLLKRLKEEKSWYVISLLHTCQFVCKVVRVKSLKTILGIKQRNSFQAKHRFKLITNLTFDTGFAIAAVFVLTLVFAISPVESKIRQYLLAWWDR